MGKSILGCIALVIGSSAPLARGQCPSGPVDAEAARASVQAALHSDPYFFDRHVTVSIEKDTIVLHGFVFSDWDLRDAMRISTGAACNWRVVDNLSIMTGGRR
jgi:hypothetical protein